MPAKTWLPLPLAAGLVAAALARPSAPLTKEPLDSVSAASAPLSPLTKEPGTFVSPEGEAPLDLWAELPALTAQEAMARTTAHLGLRETEAASFVVVATRALEQIERAWQTREAMLVGAVGLDEAAIQDAYETAKNREEAAILGLLGSSPAHLEFRDRLGEWIDAVRP